MKQHRTRLIWNSERSRPSRGAWIETDARWGNVIAWTVAPLAGRVD